MHCCTKSIISRRKTKAWIEKKSLKPQNAAYAATVNRITARRRKILS